jgi:hypothetical protein
MGYASKAGRARTSQSRPQAHAICDRCGGRFNLVDLSWQFDWRGTAIQNLRILVCSECYDQPQAQLRSIVLPIDPEPLLNARPELYAINETDNRRLEGQTVDFFTGIPIPNPNLRVTEQGQARTTQPLGIPDDYDAAAIMPLAGKVAYGVLLKVISVTALAGGLVSVTCSAPHGLSTNSQIVAEGLTVAAACGLYSVTVSSATAFTYQTPKAISARGSLLTATSRIITALVGLPQGYAQVPISGGTP